MGIQIPYFLKCWFYGKSCPFKLYRIEKDGLVVISYFNVKGEGGGMEGGGASDI